MNRSPTQAFKDLFSPKAMHLAWERYTRTRDRDAKDYIGIKSFGSNLEANLQALSKNICSGRFTPSVPAKIFKPKASGMQRTISILRIEDALVYQAFANRAAFKTYDQLAEMSEYVFGSVLHPAVKRGLKALNGGPDNFYMFRYYLPLYKKFADSVNHAIKNDEVTHRLETDITSFYDSIPHQNLIDMLRMDAGFSLDAMELLQSCLNAWSGTRDGATPGVGIPQSADASHFFANYFLSDIDRIITKNGLSYFRYMDDIRIYGHSEDELRHVLVELDRHLKRHGLSLNSQKTSVDAIEDQEREEMAIIFDYDGYNFSSASETGESVELEGMSDIHEQPQHPQGFDHGDNWMVQEIALSDYREAEKTVALYADPKKIQALDTKDRAQLREFIGQSFRFRQAAAILRDLDKLPKRSTKKVIDGWCNLLMAYFWVPRHFTDALSYYEGNTYVGTRLISCLEHLKKFEYPSGFIYQTLALTQDISTRELKNFLNILNGEESWFVKKHIYLVLLSNYRTPQFLHAIVQKAKEEQDSWLLREVAFMIAEAKIDRLHKRQTLIDLGVL